MASPIKSAQDILFLYENTISRYPDTHTKIAITVVGRTDDEVVGNCRIDEL